MSRRGGAPMGIQGTEGKALGSHADDRRRSSAAAGTGASPTSSAASERTPSATAGGPASPTPAPAKAGLSASSSPTAAGTGAPSAPSMAGAPSAPAAAGGPASPAPRPAGGPLGSPQHRRPRIGVVAVQGAFAEHVQRLRGLGCAVAELRQRGDLDQPLDALVLPGGESTTQSRLLRDAGMLGPLRERIIAGLPVLGTCAGLILLAERIEGTGDLRGLDAQAAAGRAAVEGLRTLPVTVSRNAYGRQLGSFHAEGAWEGRAADESRAIAPGQPPKPQEQPGKPDGARPAPAPVPLTFIRAPRIVQRDPGVRPLVTLGDQPVAVQYGSQIGAAFHPELDEDERIYRRLLDLAR